MNLLRCLQRLLAPRRTRYGCYGPKRPAPPGVGSAGRSGEGCILFRSPASPIEAIGNHQQYGCRRSAPMPLDAPVTSATGRMSASLRKRLNCCAAANCSDGPQSRTKCIATKSSYSIKSSAVASNFSGIVRPSAFAVLRLMTNSYLVGACTGRSGGFSPRNMR